MVLASQRCRQASVFGPVLRPPCVLHTRLPLRGGAAHWVAVTLKGVYVSKIGLAVRATPTDGPTPTPPWGSYGGYFELGFGPRNITESNKASSFKDAYTTLLLSEVQLQPNKLKTPLA